MADDLRRLQGMLGGVPPPPGNDPAEKPTAAVESTPSDSKPEESGRPFGLLGRMSGFRTNVVVSSIRSDGRPRRQLLAYSLLLLLLPLLAGGLYAGLVGKRWGALQEAKLNLRFERLNLSGDISDTILSPDGKFVASIVKEDGKHAIHITELATASDLRVTPPSTEGYSGLSFSPDGTYVYYLENHAETGTLYRVSKLGGGQRKILDSVNTAVTFSPDGSLMAFVRGNRELDTPDLMVVPTSGEGGQQQRLLARRTLDDPDAFMSDMRRAGPAWSPDGRWLACPTFSLSNDQEMNLEVLDALTGAGRRINPRPWYDISRVAWLADGSGLIAAVAESPGAPWQLQLISYPGGEVRKVTNDPNNYKLVSGARDSSLFLTLNTEESSSVWQMAVGERAQPAARAVTQRKGLAEVVWGGRGEFLYTVNDGNHVNLWAQEPSQTSARQLTFESDNSKPSFSPDGRYVVFASTRAGAMNVWRMDADGTHPVRLTDGPYEDTPSVTPDGRWVIYRTGSQLMKVSIDGGSSTTLIEKSALCPALSPDGRLLAFFTNDRPESQEWHVEIYDLASLALIKRLELPKATTPFNSLLLTPDNRLRWTPDGRRLGYVSNADGASNVWVQSLEGGAARQLTFFRDAEISSFAWSSDGKQVACVRQMKAYVPVLVRLF